MINKMMKKSLDIKRKRKNIIGKRVKSPRKREIEVHKKKNRRKRNEIKNYTTNPHTPHKFYIFPPNNNSNNVHITYGTIPPETTNSNKKNITLNDTYQYPIEHIILSLTFTKNSVSPKTSRNHKPS